MSLKQKTIKGLTWSFIDNISNYLFQFVIGIILARLLLPEEFGIVGILGIFLAVAQIFIDGGLTAVIIQNLH